VILEAWKPVPVRVTSLNLESTMRIRKGVSMYFQLNYNIKEEIRNGKE